LLFVDLDNFKVINDSLGHDAGDRVLVEAGRRLSRISRSGDTVAASRDEFVLLCRALQDDDDVHFIASRAVRAVARGSCTGQRPHRHRSIGVAVTSDPAAAPGVLLQQADIAMYEAKTAGRTASVSLAQTPARAATNYDFVADICRAIDNRAFFVPLADN